jgi:molybdopterin-guanine dinucleotide biosynthesis protein A
VVFDAIILAGASSARLDGADKALVEVGGKTLLQHALEAMAAADRIVVAGPRREAAMPVTWVQEKPAGGGPVAALAAGLELVLSDYVCLLGVDHPLVTDADIAHLLASVGADGAIAVDAQGRLQPLVAAYRTDALVGALAGLSRVHGARVNESIAGLELVLVELGDAATDCDTWDDVTRVEELMKLRR